MSRPSHFRRILDSLSPSRARRAAHAARKARHQQQRRLTLESLETRRLLATINVTTFDDVVNSSDSVTSLREAVIQANNASGADTINLQAGEYRLTRAGIENSAQSGDLDIAGKVTIVGAGRDSTTINATGMGDRVMHVLTSAGDLTIRNLTIKGGDRSGTGFGGSGAGIYTNGMLTLSNVTVRENIAGADAGAVYAKGLAQVNIDNSLITGNVAGISGGAISLNSDASHLIDATTFASNTASNGSGGAIVVLDGELDLTNSAVIDNTAGGNGGGIAHQFSVVNVSNSTFSGNQGANGGAIRAVNGTLNVTSSTLTNNIGTGGASGLSIGSAAVSLHNSIVAENAGSDISGSLSSHSFNVIGGDPRLLPLADNGGPTLTHALLPSSPAIDAGRTFGLTTDQRGRSRPFDSVAVANAGTSDGSDIGAYEYQDDLLNVSISDSLSFSTVDQGMWRPGAEPLAKLEFDQKFTIRPEVAPPETIGGIGNIANPLRVVWDAAVDSCEALLPDVLGIDSYCSSYVTNGVTLGPYYVPFKVGPFTIPGLGARPAATVRDGLAVTVDAALEAGLGGSLEVTPGDVDVSYATDVTVTISGNPVQAGDVLTIHTAETNRNATMSTSFTEIDASLTGFVDMSASVDLDQVILGVNTIDQQLFSIDTGPVSEELVGVALRTNEIELRVIGQEDPEILTGSGPFGKNIKLPVSKFAGFPLADVAIYLPELDTPDASAGNTSVFKDGVITNTQLPVNRNASSSLIDIENAPETRIDFAKIDLDLDALTLLAVPPVPLGIELSLPKFLGSAEINAFDADIGAFFGIGQTMTFEPKLMVDLHFSEPTIVETSPGSGVFAPDPVTVKRIPVGEDLSIKHPGNDLQISTTYTLQENQFINDSDVYLSPVFTANLLQLKLGGILPGLLGIGGDYHVWQQEFPLVEPIPIGQIGSPAPFALEGFTDIQGDQFTISLGSLLNPVANDDSGASFATNENTAFTTGSVLSNDTPATVGDTISVSGFDATSTLGSVSILGSGTFRYDPNGQFEALSPGQTAVDSFQYTITDNNGKTDTATVEITITGVTDLPIANDDAFGTNEDTLVTGNVLANDTNPGSSDPLTVVGFNATSSQGAQVSIRHDGHLNYDPTVSASLQGLDSGQTATDTFEYSIGDTLPATIDQEQLSVNAAAGGRDQWQSFTAGQTGNLTQIDLRVSSPLWPNASPAILSIYGGEGTDGSLLSIQAITLEPDLNTFQSFTLTNPVLVGAGEQYSYRIEVPDIQVGFVYVNTTNPYSGGRASSNPEWDLLFKTHVAAIANTVAATVTVTVTGVNDDPIANDDGGIGYSSDEDSSFTTANVLANDVGVNGNSLAIVGHDTTSALGVPVISNGDGTFDYDPTAATTLQSLSQDASATDTFQYTIAELDDQQNVLGTNTATVTINVTGVNDAPKANDDSGPAFSGSEDESFVTGSVLANDFDVDADDTLSVVAVDSLSSLGAAISRNNAGTFTYDPTGVQVLQTLAAGKTVIDTFQYAVAEEPPAVIDQAQPDLTAVSGGTDQWQSFTAGLTGKLRQLDIKMSSPLNGQDSPATLSIYEGEGTGGALLASQDITIEAGSFHRFQSFALDSSISLAAGSRYTYRLEIPEIQVGFLSVNTGEPYAGGRANFFADWDQVFQTHVSPLGVTDTATVTISVVGINDAPVATDDAASTDEDIPVVIDVLANDDDVDGDALTPEIDTGPANGSAGVNEDGTITYSPNANFNGDDSFTYAVSDGNGGTETAFVNITVNAVNDAPIANDDTASTDEDTAVAIDVLDNDNDVDGDSLSVASFDGVSNLGASISRNADGTLAYDPTNSTTLQALAIGETTTDVFEYTVADELSPLIDQAQSELDAVSGSTNQWQSFTAGISGALSQLDVKMSSPLSDQPSLATLSVYQGEGTNGALLASQPITIEPQSFNNYQEFVLDNPPSLDAGSQYTFRIEIPEVQVAFLSINRANAYSGGRSNFSFDDWDLVFQTHMSPVGLADTSEVVITVTGLNDAPVADADSASTDEDAAVTVAVLANDSDVDGDALTPEIDTDPANGSAGVNEDGTITYSPNANFNGDDSFTYTVDDGNGGIATATVNVSVNPVNDASVSQDVRWSAVEDGAAVIGSFDANDIDSDDDSTTLVYSILSSPAEGAVSNNNDGTFTFAPGSDFQDLADGETRDITFTYKAVDSHAADSNVATVTITVTGVNDAPTMTALNSDRDEPCISAADGVVTIEGSFADLDLSNTHTVTVDWGDGSPVESLTVDQFADTFSGRHTYATGGIFEIIVTVDDGEGGSDTSTTTGVSQGVGVVDGTLFIIGTDGNDRVKVKFKNKKDELKVDVKLNQGSSDGGDRVKETIQLSSVDRIVTYLCGGNDHYNGGSGGGSAAIPQFVFGGAGNDRIQGGRGADVLSGGTGRDKLFGDLGNDILIGGDGRDNLLGGRGDDLLIGGSAANEDNLASVDAAFADWASKDRAAALLDLGAITDDGDKDLLKGGKGTNHSIGGVGDRRKR